jgi:hypothetical protein
MLFRTGTFPSIPFHSTSLKDTACPELFELFQHLAHVAVEIGRNRLLLGVRQEVEALAEVAVDDRLYGRVVAAVVEVVAADEGCAKRANVLHVSNSNVDFFLLTISKVLINSTSSLEMNGISAPTAPEMVVYTITSRLPGATDTLLSEVTTDPTL